MACQCGVCSECNWAEHHPDEEDDQERLILLQRIENLKYAIIEARNLAQAARWQADKSRIGFLGAMDYHRKVQQILMKALEEND